jgi:hypothetical protein
MQHRTQTVQTAAKAAWDARSECMVLRSASRYSAAEASIEGPRRDPDED